MGASRRMNGFRDGLYANFRTATKRTQKHFRRSMTYAYIDILAIIVVIRGFYVVVPWLSPIMYGMFGGGPYLWDFILVMLNFVALVPPTKYLVDTGAKGEVLGETISPWVEAKINDGVMEYVMYRLVKERS